jgi:UDP-glucose-4-epimerase GalE
MHFAGRSLVAESHGRPDLYYRVNVTGTLKLLEAMVPAAVRLLLYSSSAAVYGIPPKNPIPEDTACLPISPYGETKLAAERMIDWYARAHRLKAISLRYSNAAGADPEGELGEWHEPETHLIPRLVAGALDGRGDCEVYGTDYPTPDGTCIRDFIHVSDLADAHVLALRGLLNDGPTGAFNLGTGRGHSVLDVVDAVLRVFPRVQARIARTARRAGDPPVLVADPSRFARHFDWQPIPSDLDTVIKTAAGWAERMRHGHFAAGGGSPRGDGSPGGR